MRRFFTRNNVLVVIGSTLIGFGAYKLGKTAGIDEATKRTQAVLLAVLAYDDREIMSLRDELSTIHTLLNEYINETK